MSSFSAVLKSFGFIAMYLLIGVISGIVCSGSDSVHITFVTDAVTAVIGLLYCCRYVFPNDRVCRENAGFMGVGRFLGLFCELGAIWLLAQMTTAMAQTFLYDPSFDSYQENLVAANVSEMLLFTVFLAPAFEEILMRGMVQSCLRERYGPVVAVLVSSAVFAILHGTAVHLYFASVLGIAFGLLYERTRFLPACILAHVLCNFMSFALSGLSFSCAPWALVAAGVLNFWMGARFLCSLSGLWFDYQASRFMARNDFEESCFGDRHQDG